MMMRTVSPFVHSFFSHAETQRRGERQYDKTENRKTLHNLLRLFVFTSLTSLLRVFASLREINQLPRNRYRITLIRCNRGVSFGAAIVSTRPSFPILPN